jgi:hypothetical protein
VAAAGYALTMALDRGLIQQVRALDPHDLRRLQIFVAGLLASREGGVLAPRRPPRRQTVTYRQESVRCGQPSCTRCPHGPYWYAYWRQDGRVRKRYLGKELPEGASTGPA